MKKTRSGAVSGASASRSAIAGALPTQRRPILRGFFLALMLLAAAGAGEFVCWLGLRDPLAALPRATENPVATGFAAEPRNGRTLQHVVLHAPGVGRIGLAISLPDPLPKRPLPVVMVLGGLATGERNIRHIPGGGDNAIVGYDWPIPTRMPPGWDFVREAPDLYDRALRVPGQIAAALDWLAGQGWADPERTSLLSFSLGALVAPAAQRPRRAPGPCDRLDGARLWRLASRCPARRQPLHEAPLGSAHPLSRRRPGVPTGRAG
jgi:hypothetical protein